MGGVNDVSVEVGCNVLGNRVDVCLVGLVLVMFLLRVDEWYDGEVAVGPVEKYQVILCCFVVIFMM